MISKKLLVELIEARDQGIQPSYRAGLQCAIDIVARHLADERIESLRDTADTLEDMIKRREVIDVDSVMDLDKVKS